MGAKENPIYNLKEMTLADKHLMKLEWESINREIAPKHTWGGAIKVNL